MQTETFITFPLPPLKWVAACITWDYRDFENRLVTHDATKRLPDKGTSLYQAFNDLWRPAVLFRLGYPIRNVGEGVIRASLYETSLAPVVDAFKAARDGAGNLLFRAISS